MSEQEVAEVEVTPVEVAPELPAFHPGVPDGTIEANGEKVVYEYDEAGELTGWHKEAVEPVEVVK